MKVSVDTAHDSEEDIRKVIAMLKHFVGDGQVVTNDMEIEQAEPEQQETSEETGGAFASMFNDTSVLSAEEESEEPSELEQDVSGQETEVDEQEAEEPEQESQDLFDDLFSDDKPKESEEDGRNPKIQMY